MDVVAKSLLLLLAVMVGLLTFRHCCAPDEVEDYKRLVKAWSDLANALRKKCEAQEELIQSQAEYIKKLEEAYEQRKTD